MFITVRVYPNATKNEIAGFNDGVWLVRISAPPVKGKANTELISFLSKILGVGRSSLSITKGHTNRNKLIAVDSLTEEEIIKRLSFSSDVSSK